MRQGKKGENQTMSIRRATPGDAEKIAQIETLIQKAPWSLGVIQTEIEFPQGQGLLITDDETDSIVMGYIFFRTHLEPTGSRTEILNLGVDLPFRGLGLAKQLLHKALSLVTRQEPFSVFLNVRKSNNPAIQLYQNHGFSTSHIRKNFYSDGEDAYEMVFDGGPV